MFDCWGTMTSRNACSFSILSLYLRSKITLLDIHRHIYDLYILNSYRAGHSEPCARFALGHSLYPFQRFLRHKQGGPLASCFKPPENSVL